MEINLNLYKNKQIHFIGCAGAGMAPLLQMLKDKGFAVSGSDLKRNATTENFEKQGIRIFEGHKKSNLPESPENSLIVYSSAVLEHNPELAHARAQGRACLRRGELLPLVARLYKRTAAVSGSHGKTTVTAMLTHILKKNSMEPGYLIGGKLCGEESPSASGNGDIFVAEVDESDGTHILMDSHLAIVTNVEDDHCWSVGGAERLFENFKIFAEKGKKLLCVKSELAEKLFAGHKNKIELDPNNISFSRLSESKISEWRGYQLVNAAIAVSAAEQLGLLRTDAEDALNSFSGIERRMIIHFQNNHLIVAEDYAHHPTEVNGAISSLRSRFPEHRMLVAFQPHRYARLEHYFEPFAKELAKADEIIITPVFAAWVEKGTTGSEELSAKIGEKSSFMDATWDKMAEEIMAKIAGKTLIVLLGAGDIDGLLPHIIRMAKNG